MEDEGLPGTMTTGPTTALLVDDDLVYAQFVREALAHAAGAPVTLRHARSLTEAERCLASGGISVVLLDVHLPDGNGLDWLRTRRAQLDAAVLILTADTRFDHDVQVVAGAEDLLVKSHLDGDQIVRTIRYAAERERTRQQLLESREYFQSLIEHARDLITVVDPAGRILYQSPASRHIIGTPGDTAFGTPFADLVVPSDRPRLVQLLAEVFTGDGQPARAELTVQRPDGGHRIVEVAASRIAAAGPPRAVLNSRDVTARRRAEDALRAREEQLRQSHKMEAVGRLAGGIAHDFCNVLTVITAACEKLEDGFAAGHPDPAQVGTILRNAERATSLTRQLLAFSRQQTLAPAVLDLGALVRRTGQLLEQLIGEHIPVQLDIASDLRAIEADPVQIEQVLMNLAINARDAMPDGGLLRVTVSDFTATPAFTALHHPMSPGPYVLLEVSDTGHGMSLETQARAFEPFFTTKDPTKGTGLGLSTVYGIVKQSGGFIWIDSAPGAGCRFRIYLPIVDATPARVAEPAPRHTGIPARPGTILLTEDEPDVRELVRDMLEVEGYTVFEASDPADALRVSRSLPEPVDLLLTDVVMPGGTGRALAEQMTAAWPGLKVLYMSGYPEHGAAHGSVLEPGVPFLPKPFTRQLLLDQIRTLLA